MILRLNDWNYYPDAIVDLHTTNTSFLNHAAVLKEMGVKHWYCALALTQPELQGIDPYDPTLDADTKIKIVYEIFTNPWYFFREVCRIPQDGGDPVPFKLHRGNFALFWSFFNNIDIALLLIRQQGKTIAIAALLCYLLRILKNSRTVLMTRGSDLRSETVTKIKQIRDALPKYCWKYSKDDADNTEMVTYNARENKLLTVIAQNSAQAALNAARGVTAARFISDETAFTRFIRVMLPAALAAGTTARKIAEENGIPYGNIFTTTPGKRDELDGKFVYELFHEGYYWDEHLMDVVCRAELVDIINRGSKGDRTLIHAPFTHRQLGMTDADLYKAISNAGGTKEDQLRDFGLQWTAGSLSSPLSVDEARTVSESVITPQYLEMYPNCYCIRWYYKEDEIEKKMKAKHIIGLDTSDAVGRDNISLVILNEETLEVAATAIVNESNLIVFSNWMADILVRHVNTILVIERKSSAPTIIDSLLLTLPARGVEPTRRIYNVVIQNRPDGDLDLKEFKKSSHPRDERFYEIYRKYFGFVTTGTARKTLYGEVLQTAVRMAGNMIRDKALASELLSLVVKDGRIDHKSSGHDDCVIAWLLACWFMLNGRRLDYYGVSNKILLNRQRTNKNGEDFDKEVFEREECQQKEITSQIDTLCTDIAKNRSPLLKNKLERRLRLLLAQLKLDTSQAATIGELQTLIRNEKLQSRYLS